MHDLKLKKKKYHALAAHTNVGGIKSLGESLHKYPVTYKASQPGGKQGIQKGPGMIY